MIRKQRLGGSNIANLTTEALLPSVRFVFEFIMAMLFYVPFGEFIHLHMHKFIDFHESSIYIRKCLPKSMLYTEIRIGNKNVLTPHRISRCTG